MIATKYGSFVWRLRSDERGVTAVIFGLSVPLLFLCAGIAIDAARWFDARHETAAAVDAAVLAGGRTLQIQPDDPDAAIAVALKVYRANTESRMRTLSDSISFSLADNNQAIVASGTAKIGTSFLAMAGITELDLASDAQAGFAKAKISTGGNGGGHVEISLMLDVTGSMCDDGAGPCQSGNKLTGLKTAAKDLIDIVVAQNQGQFTSKVALIPFSTRVRVGPDGGGANMMRDLTNLNATWSGWYRECTQGSGTGGSESGGNWTCTRTQVQQKSNWKVMPCVTDRYNNNIGFDATDTRPSSGVWLNAHDGSRMTLSWDSSDVTPSSDRGLSSADPANHWNYSSDGVCADVANNNEIMPLSNDKSALKNRIDGLEAYGSTAGALGTAWAWYTLSPNWDNVFTGNSRPRPYSDLTTLQPSGAPLLRKVAVLMTDGGYNTYRGWKDQSQQDVSNFALQLCTNMKAQGIEVYTVGFALDQLTASERTIAEATLKACGTDLSHFYDTLTVPQLQAAFRDIALKMTTLALIR